MADRISVFLSYRRADTPHVSGRLGDRLAERYQLFMDIDNIRPGMDFTRVVREAVAECDVLLALIGRNWLTAADPDGLRRLDSPRDWVVEEIGQGLRREITVIPVLVDGAAMPEADEVPPTLEQLTYRQALPLRHESFSADVARLFDAIEHAVRPAAAEPPAPPPVELYKDLEYSRALAAAFNRRWDEAALLLTNVAERFPNEPDVTTRLAEATGQANVARLEAEASQAEQAGQWREALNALNELKAAAPERDLTERIRAAERGQQIARLSDELRGLHVAGEWRGVVATADRIAALDPSAADPDGLTTDARRRLAAIELEDTYADGLRALTSGQLEEAGAALTRVASQAPGYRDTDDLLAYLAGRTELAQWHALAAEAERRGDWDAAVGYLRLIVDRDGDYEGARGRLDKALARRASAPASTQPEPVGDQPETLVHRAEEVPAADRPTADRPTADRPTPDPLPADSGSAGGVRAASEGARPSGDSLPVAAGSKRTAWIATASGGVVLLILAGWLSTLEKPHMLAHVTFPGMVLLALAGLVSAVVLGELQTREARAFRRVLRLADLVAVGLGGVIGLLLVIPVTKTENEVTIGFWLVILGLLVAGGVGAFFLSRSRLGYLAVWPALVVVSSGLFWLTVLPVPMHDVW